MKRLFFTLLATGLAMSAMAQTTATNRIFKKRAIPSQLEQFHQLYERSLHQARATQAHDSVSFAIWDNGSWMDLQHSKIIRNAQHQIVEVVNYDPMASPTQPVSKFEMSYTQGKLNRQGLLTPGGSGWQQEMALENRYDAQGNLTSTTFSIWDQQGNLQFFFGDSLEYGYHNQQIVSVGYAMGFAMGTAIEWAPVSLIENIHYDPMGLPTDFTQAEYDPQTGNWLRPNKFDKVKWGFGFTAWSELFVSVVPLNQGLEPYIPSPLPSPEPTEYLATDWTGMPLYRASSFVQGSLVQKTKLESYHIGAGWLPDFELSYTYNAQNKITALVYATFDTQTGRFVPEERQINNYLNAYFTGNTFELYQNNQWTIQLGQSFTYSFNGSGSVTEIVGQRYDPASSSWLNSERFTYHYGAVAAGLGRLSMADVKIFPNPTQGQLSIQLPSSKNIEHIVVRNMQGQQLYQAQFNFDNTSEHELDLSNLPAGIYLVQIQSGQETGVARVVKR